MRQILILLIVTPVHGASLWSWLEPLRSRCGSVFGTVVSSADPLEQQEMNERNEAFEQVASESLKEQRAITACRLLIDELSGETFGPDCTSQRELMHYIQFLFSQRARLLQMPQSELVQERLQDIDVALDRYYEKKL